MPHSSSRGPAASPEDPFPPLLLSALVILARAHARNPCSIPQADIDVLHGIFADHRIPDPTDRLEFRIPTNRTPGDAVTLWKGYRPNDPIPDRKTLSELAIPPGTWPHAIEALRRERLAGQAMATLAAGALHALAPDAIRAKISEANPWHEMARAIILALHLAQTKMDDAEWHRRRAATIDAIGSRGIQDPCGWVTKAERRHMAAADEEAAIPSDAYPWDEFEDFSRDVA